MNRYAAANGEATAEWLAPWMEDSQDFILGAPSAVNRVHGHARRTLRFINSIINLSATLTATPEPSFRKSC
jgi:hypothetical protein